MSAHLAFARPPSMLRAYLRAVTSRKRAAGVQPGDVPALRATLDPVTLDSAALATYRDVCGVDAEVPLSYPQLLITPVHIHLLTDPQFPLPAMGLVHPRCTLVQHRALRVGEEVAFDAGLSDAREVRNGITFDLTATARVGDEVVWESRAETFARTRKSEGGKGDPEPHGPWEHTVSFEVPADAGRRYARVSGDRNPVHLRPLLSRMFGYRQPIAHGWWLLARCVGHLDKELLASAAELELELRRPVFLPSTLRFVWRATDTGRDFAVLDDADKVRLSGHVRA